MPVSKLRARPTHWALTEKAGFVSRKMYQLKSQISPKKRENKQLMKTNTNINKMEKKDKIDLIFEKTNEVRQTYQA